MSTESGLRLEERDGGWGLAGVTAARFLLVDEYLAHLADRNYSPKTVRAYGYDLLAFCRWLSVEDLPLSGVTTEVLLKFLRACREATVPGRPGPNVVRLSGRRMDQYAATTINRRLAAISGLFTCTQLHHNGQPITFTAVAALTGLSRTTLYRNPTLRTVIDEHRHRTATSGTLTGLTDEIATLRLALEAIAARVRRHEEQLRRLTARSN